MKRWTKEDLEPQQCVAAVIRGPNIGDVLVQKHVKLRKWTIPIGKVGPHENYIGVLNGLRKELREECGIQVMNSKLLKQTMFKGSRDGQIMYIPMYLFLIVDYKGEIQNLEPHKHSEQLFMNPADLVKKKEPISHALRMWIKEEKKRPTIWSMFDY